MKLRAGFFQGGEIFFYFSRLKKPGGRLRLVYGSATKNRSLANKTKGHKTGVMDTIGLYLLLLLAGIITGGAIAAIVLLPMAQTLRYVGFPGLSV